PTWFSVALDISLVQPPLAFFVERVFSALRSRIDKRQEACLSDRIMTAILLKYIRSRERHML
ncbi:unnamed protein product, partial [Hapterophycus canaliculatus]